MKKAIMLVIAGYLIVSSISGISALRENDEITTVQERTSVSQKVEVKHIDMNSPERLSYSAEYNASTD